MTRAQLSVYMFGLYLISGVALPFLIIPHFALGMFGISAGDGMWVRFVGVLAGILGAFYIAAVLTRTDIMLGWTVPARYATATFLCTMVALGKVGLALLIFAALDALTASITWIAIKADAEEKAAA
ncbi:MAG: hypothetical protein MPJ78_03055 [Hyphomicrobiaceae bacterium]|nr:hypothetical protein [Hyphomicrobiaceae bacterium]